MRKTMRRMLTGLLAAAMTAGCLLTASAAEIPNSPERPPVETPHTSQKDVTTEPGKDGVASVVDTGSKGNAALKEVEATSEKSVTVDSKVTVNGVKYTVTKIDADAFAKCTKMTSVTLPSTIETIKKNAFNGAKKLKKAELKGKPTVKGGAFKGAEKLTTLKVTGKATFEKAAFKGTKLKTITISKDATFAKGAFKGADTKNTVIKVPKMSAKKLKKLQKELADAGFKGKIKMV